MIESLRTFLPPYEDLAVCVSVLLVFAPARGAPHHPRRRTELPLTLPPAPVLKAEEGSCTETGKEECGARWLGEQWGTEAQKRVAPKLGHCL